MNALEDFSQQSWVGDPGADEYYVGQCLGTPGPRPGSNITGAIGVYGERSCFVRHWYPKSDAPQTLATPNA
jgi:hypothetical protein